MERVTTDPLGSGRGTYAARGAIALALVAAGVGCGESWTAQPGDPVAEVGWIAPAEGDTLRGTVELAAWADLGEPVRGMTFLVDGEPLEEDALPPWLVRWRPTVASEAPRAFQLDASARGDSRSVAAEPQHVYVIRDDPPALLVQLPGRTPWAPIEDGVVLEARACDREDGPLDPSSIRWTTGSGRRFLGPTLPLVLLGPGSHEITAQVLDSAGNPTETRRRVRPFLYLGSAQPEAAGNDLRSALAALDLGRLDQLLDPDFRFHSCLRRAAADPDTTFRAEFLQLLTRFRDAVDVRAIEWGGRIVTADPPVRGWSVAEWENLGVEVETGPPPRPPEVACEPEGTTDPGGIRSSWRTVGLRARLSWRWEENRGWRLWSWKELSPGDGPGIAGLLRDGPGGLHLRPSEESVAERLGESLPVPATVPSPGKSRRGNTGRNSSLHLDPNASPRRP